MNLGKKEKENKNINIFIKITWGHLTQGKQF